MFSEQEYSFQKKLKEVSDLGLRKFAKLDRLGQRGLPVHLETCGFMTKEAAGHIIEQQELVFEDCPEDLLPIRIGEMYIKQGFDCSAYQR